MLSAALRDMQWRRRRLVIAILSTGLVFAMTLVLTGLATAILVYHLRFARRVRTEPHANELANP